MLFGDAVSSLGWSIKTGRSKYSFKCESTKQDFKNKKHQGDRTSLKE
jgi:hypothetical protein